MENDALKALLEEIRDTQKEMLKNSHASLALQREAVEAQRKSIEAQDEAIKTQKQYIQMARIVGFIILIIIILLLSILLRWL